jgi:DNA topoisomerase-1
MKEKWNTLEHQGPLFPEQYIVKGYSLNNEKLSSLAEEMIWKYVPYLETDYVQKPRFNVNFYNCLKLELTEKQRQISFPAAPEYQSLFKMIAKEQEKIKEAKKNKTKADREKEKIEKEKIKEVYGFALVDGKKQAISTYQIEPSGIYMTRGEHPLLGMWKYAPTPETVIINCSGNAPKPPDGHSWKKVVCNKNSLSPYSFLMNAGGKKMKQKRITFSYASDIGAEADSEKFEKALTLHKHWDDVQQYITDAYTQNKDSEIKECGLIAWLIQNTAIRVGHEKNEDMSAATVGASTLQKENMNVIDNKDGTFTLKLNFIGKDSIQYDNAFTFNDVEVKNALIKLLNSKNKHEKVFNVSASDVNKFLQKKLPNITVKMFRPALGSHIMVQQLIKENVSKANTQHEKIMSFNRANLKTAELLNHKRTVAKTFNESLTKMEERVQTSKEKAVELENKAKEKLAQYKKDIENLEKNFTGKELKEKKARIKEKIEKLRERVDRAKVRAVVVKDKLTLKKDGKETALGTSRGSYLDPRMVVSWCKNVDLDITKLYTKSLINRFQWALNTDENFWKEYQ